MSDATSAIPQAMAEQLMLELSAGVSLDEAAGILGIQSSTALHIMQQHAMEIRLHNLAKAWADAQFKMPAEMSTTPSASRASADLAHGLHWTGLPTFYVAGSDTGATGSAGWRVGAGPERRQR
jgi:hypothetical protein